MLKSIPANVSLLQVKNKKLAIADIVRKTLQFGTLDRCRLFLVFGKMVYAG